MLSSHIKICLKEDPHIVKLWPREDYIEQTKQVKRANKQNDRIIPLVHCDEPKTLLVKDARASLTRNSLNIYIYIYIYIYICIYIIAYNHDIRVYIIYLFFPHIKTVKN